MLHRPPLGLSVLIAIIFSATTGCAAQQRSTVQQPKPPFTISVVASSREVVLQQTLPWEEQMMGYFKVLEPRPGYWQMWYSGWDNRRKDDYSGYLLYAASKDGHTWRKQLRGGAKNILMGTGHPQQDGVVEQDVFMVQGTPYPYKMIYTARDSGDRNKEKTFITESADGIQWRPSKVLWNRKHDSQFSVIQKDNRFYIYLRYWTTINKVRYRTIGRAITDRYWNTIEEPVTVFAADPNSDFPHLYNPAASKVSPDLDLFFPTYFNEATNRIRIGLLYMYRNQPFSTDMDLTEALLEKSKNNWAIVSPGLIPAGKNTYWLYYYATNMVHSDYEKTGRQFRYYRIKIKITR
ncbi:hypothetical protein [Niabella sp.]|uniref:hypothetical protein n=1 Tax=Niabella sp. TaxID=1962976 RepID=UPI00260C3A2A|nr:hypothetical protein [Niabella sp.]